MLELTVVVGLVVLTSGACSLFEAVLYSAPLAEIDALERAGRPSGAILRRLRSHVDRPIAAILSLNTVANTGGAALAGAIAARVLGSVSIGYFSAAFTLAILLFSEIIPKTTGVIYARRLAGPVARTEPDVRRYSPANQTRIVALFAGAGAVFGWGGGP